MFTANNLLDLVNNLFLINCFWTITEESNQVFQSQKISMDAQRKQSLLGGKARMKKKDVWWDKQKG